MRILLSHHEILKIYQSLGNPCAKVLHNLAVSCLAQLVLLHSGIDVCRLYSYADGGPDLTQVAN